MHELPSSATQGYVANVSWAVAGSRERRVPLAAPAGGGEAGGREKRLFELATRTYFYRFQLFNFSDDDFRTIN